ncbi:MAG: hypothetical protein H7327_14325 [Herminiimonas sp.]|nr:hypothetical protein [Herminiimonas sp.]
MNPAPKTKHALLSLIAGASLAATLPASATPLAILFVGNSYTFSRVDPAMSYNAAAVHDLTARFNAISSTGSNPWEPHPWGGIAGIFKQMTVEAGLDYDVSLSARNGVSLRGHFLNTANTVWDLRGNIASRKWDVVVLQEQSDATLPPGKGKNANPAQFRAYANQLEAFIHTGAAQDYTETVLYGSMAACQATGQSQPQCETRRRIAVNPHANAQARVYLTQTWARPDMVYPHWLTVSDNASPDGRRIVDSSPAGSAATLYYPTLSAMTRDLHDANCAAARANAHFFGIVAVGAAFQRAFDQAVIKTSGFYDADGRYSIAQPGEPMNLWWDDYLHSSKYGSYLDALVQFGTITGRDPLTLGAGETAARDLGITPAQTQTLQRIASEQLAAASGTMPGSCSL